jgi:predicted transcriptional regulator
MDQEILFTGSKWDIIAHLSNAPKSPLELAKLAKTSIANVSQQLRLLEMAGMVKSIRVPNRDKGQPRIVYSLVKDTAFIITTTRTYAGKKLIDIDHRDLAILRIFSASEGETRHAFERAFWTVEPDLEKIQAILVDTKNLGITLFTADPQVRKKYQTLNIKRKGDDLHVKTFFAGKDDVHALSQKKPVVIYDPQNHFPIKYGVDQ